MTLYSLAPMLLWNKTFFTSPVCPGTTPSLSYCSVTLRCWVLSLQSLELPPAFPPKMCSFTQQIFTNFLPCAGPCGEHKDESDMGPVHKCCQSSKGHLAVGQARGRFSHHGPQNSAVCCMFLEGEGDELGGIQVNLHREGAIEVEL